MVHHVPRKRFGQHFLHDEHVIKRIISVIDPQPNERLIEIGPGKGAITVPLLERQVLLHVVELDRDLLHYLKQLQDRFSRLTILHQDALKLDLSSVTKEKVRITGNLPYNISSPLLFHLFEQGELIDDMIFMLQKEVVDRLCAAANDSNYSRLSVMGQFYCDLEKHFDVEPVSFSPPPKVRSSIISMRPKPIDLTLDTALFTEVVKQAFSQRRKMLRNNLSRYLNEEDYGILDIDPTQRAQELSVENFTTMTRHLMTKKLENFV